MANPLTVINGGGGAIIVRSEDELREWCAQKNEWASRIGFERWYFVSHDKETGARRVEAKDGHTASSVVKILSGWYPDYDGWTREKLAKEYGLLKFLARQGMPEHDFAALKLAAH